jgi:hypothetical protein
MTIINASGFGDFGWEPDQTTIGTGNIIHIINSLPLPLAMCPYCDTSLAIMCRGEIVMDGSIDRESLGSGRAVICKRCKHFITQEFAPVNEQWVRDNQEHPFSRCVQALMRYPLIPTDFGRDRCVPTNILRAICYTLDQVTCGWSPQPVHPDVGRFTESSEIFFAELVRRRMTLPGMDNELLSARLIR